MSGAFALLLSLSAGSVSAAPLIVRAQASLELRALDTGRSLQVHGSLADDRGRELSGRTVWIQVLGRRARVLWRTEVVTDTSGQFSMEFPHSTRALGVRADSEQDSLLDSGSVEVEFIRTQPPAPSELTASGTVRSGPLDDSVRVVGRLTVAGVGRKATLSASVGSDVDTDGAGFFELELGGWRFPSRRGVVRFSYDGGSDALPASAEIRFVLPVPEPTPAWVHLGPLGFTLLLLIGGWIRRWLRSPRLPRPSNAGAGTAPAPLLSPDLSPAVPYALADQDGVAGVLVDRTEGLPLAGGRVSLLPGNRVALADRHGRFRFDSIPPGVYTLVGEAVGHMPGQAPARFPHRGDLGAIRLALMPVREAVRDTWRQAAVGRQAAAGGQGVDPWPSRTPAEVAVGVMGDFAKLTRLLEETWWSGRVADVQRAADAERLAGGEGAP